MKALSRYAQLLWITLCINCYIERLTAVFTKVLLNRIKTRQLNGYYNYQQVMIFSAIMQLSISGIKATLNH